MLSNDEIKVLLTILNQVSFKIPDFTVVQSIFDKLNKEVKPEVTPIDPGSFDPSNPDKPVPTPEPTPEPVEGEVIP